MLILLAVIAAIILGVVEIVFYSKQKPTGEFLLDLVKNTFLTAIFSLAAWKYILQNKHFLVVTHYSASDFIQFFVVSIVVGVVISKLRQSIQNRGKSHPDHIPAKKHLTRNVVSLILLFLGSLCLFLTIWGKSEFGDMGVDQLLINFFSPTSGTGTTDIVSALEGPVFITVLLSTLFALAAFSGRQVCCTSEDGSKKSAVSFMKRNWSMLLAVTVLIGGLAYGIEEFHLINLTKAYLTKSSIIDDHFVDPRDANLRFPEKKRNLIHIYLESMENSYMSKELGGFMDVNMIPELTQLASEGYCFSHSDGPYGGPQSAVGTTWAVASMVNMTTGLPMKAPTEANAYGEKDNFLPGAYTLGDILAEQGYEQTLMFGADADFGGLTYYFESHGDFKIMDYKYAKKHGLIPKNYQVWWGYEDDKLFEFAKEEITRLSQTGNPFHFVMETADTHRPDGYLSANAPTPYENQYANVVAYSSAQVYQFVRWIQSQPFYEDTTVVITGDHLSMETNFFEFYKFDDEYRRSQYNVILNPAAEAASRDVNILRNRNYANFDLFPTILASMGVTMDGNRLGIGTNLFSGEKTLFEEFGFEEANSELEKMSVYYNTHILKKAE